MPPFAIAAPKTSDEQDCARGGLGNGANQHWVEHADDETATHSAGAGAPPMSPNVRTVTSV
jgi:hypothetical protein